MPLVIAVALNSSAGFGATPSPAIQLRIDALLKRRLAPEPLPFDLPNPFQPAKGSIRELTRDDLANQPATMAGVVATPTTEPGAPPKDPVVVSSAEVLAGATARLKVGGFIVLKDQIQVVINGAPRKEGDLLAVEWNDGIVYLRIVRLLANEIVLRFGDAEATLRL